MFRTENNYLQVAVSDNHVFGATLEGLETCSHLIARYAVFEAVYLTRTSSAHVELELKLVGLYAEVLRYFAKARQYFAASTKSRSGFYQ